MPFNIVRTPIVRRSNNNKVDLQTRQFIKRKLENEIISFAPIMLPCSRKLGIDVVNENFYSSQESRCYTVFIVRP